MELAEWVAAWTAIAKHPPSNTEEATAKIDAVVELCQMPVRRDWTRPNIEDHLWAAGPYRRSDRGKPSGPERTIEDQILGAATDVAEGRSCLGGQVIDAINAIPLTRRPKVEADVLLLVDHGDAVSSTSQKSKVPPITRGTRPSNCCASCACSRASHTVDYFHRKNRKLPPRLPATGLVLAPEIYYKNSDRLAYTWRLIDSVISRVGLDIRMAVWDAGGSQITELRRTTA